MEAAQFKAGKQQRRALARLKHEITGTPRPARYKGKDNEPFDLSKRWSAIETDGKSVTSELNGNTRTLTVRPPDARF